MPDFKAASEEAKKRGLPHLEKILIQRAEASATSDVSLTIPPPPHRDKPRVSFLYPAKWCGERHTRDLVEHLTDEFEIDLVVLENNMTVPLDSDLYIIRSVWPITHYPSLKRVGHRIIAIVESDRAFDPQWTAVFNCAYAVVPQNKTLVKRSRKYAKRVYGPIGNGIDTATFHPADKFPDEFIVGAAGNFSNHEFDEWKGFSRYIVPACKLAGVKLKWCGWLGRNCDGSMRSPQLPLSEMPDFFRSISCLVSMSKSESCSSIISEAMATGIPVISTKTGWHYEEKAPGILWIDRKENIGRKEMDIIIRNLAMKILLLKQKHELCQLLGQQGRAFAENYSWKKMANLWRPILRRVLTAQKS